MQKQEIGEHDSESRPELLSDKRFYKRFRKDNPVRFFGQSEWREGVLLDISMMGASVLSDEEWSLGEKIRIMSPMFQCELLGEVIRMNQVDEGKRYALIFHDMTDAAILEILNKIATCR
ncbi:pilus assembly protein PilZ [Leptospira perolatii]|uniref:Pilus assembly protein PilZ n=1 Tax=Leptospira perolatii TaxID=2023191 RepID=A0A2M9ZRE0_9LEPT|nr:PilZ domain-containing protein [Leptospira perolatii]PJZ71116.1 pilus assembly protein PilZ [Leptospira perolatii]PJZ74648.1 pilus assembly protein PilZ [Leptospira perolatii]